MKQLITTLTTLLIFVPFAWAEMHANSALIGSNPQNQNKAVVLEVSQNSRHAVLFSLTFDLKIGPVMPGERYTLSDKEYAIVANQTIALMLETVPALSEQKDWTLVKQCDFALIKEGNLHYTATSSKVAITCEIDRK